MQQSQDHPSYAALFAHAKALVNPASGFANDYLNVLNEIVMLVENVAIIPDFIHDILAWQAISYENYFTHSPLPERATALAAYRNACPDLRSAFEAQIAEIVAQSETVKALLRPLPQDTPISNELASALADIAAHMMSCVQKATHLVNSGEVLGQENPQLMADRLMQVA